MQISTKMIKQLNAYLLLLSLLLPLCSLAQAPANDEPAGAITLSNLNNWCAAAGEINNDSATYNSSLPYTYNFESHDLWYRFQAIAPAVEIEISEAVADPADYIIIRVRDSSLNVIGAASTQLVTTRTLALDNLVPGD